MIDQALVEELRQKGIKHTPEKMQRIARTRDGTIVFLEDGTTGDNGSGLAHIIENHKADFADRGISEAEIPDLLMMAVIAGKVIGKQGKSRQIFEVNFNGVAQIVAIEIANNGYIVGATPAKRPKIGLGQQP